MSSKFSRTFEWYGVTSAILLVQITLSHPLTMPDTGKHMQNKDLFLTEEGEHVEIYMYNLQQGPVCHWLTVDQKLFLCLNLYEIACATVICT